MSVLDLIVSLGDSIHNETRVHKNLPDSTEPAGVLPTMNVEVRCDEYDGHWKLVFTFDDHPPLIPVQDSSSSDVRVVGFSAWYRQNEPMRSEEPGAADVDIETLMTHLDHFSRLRVIVIGSPWYEDLIVMVRRHRPVQFNVREDTRKYVLACPRRQYNQFPGGSDHSDDSEDGRSSPDVSDDDVDYMQSDDEDEDGDSNGEYEDGRSEDEHEYDQNENAEDGEYVGIDPITLSLTGTPSLSR